MAEHKTRPQNHDEEDQGQPGTGRQHPTGSGAAYREPSKRGSSGGSEDKKKGLRGGTNQQPER